MTPIAGGTTKLLSRERKEREHTRQQRPLSSNSRKDPPQPIVAMPNVHEPLCTCIRRRCGHGSCLHKISRWMSRAIERGMRVIIL